MKTYEVSLSLNASITVEVTAENELEAEEKAIEKFYNKDLDHVDADHYHYYEMHLLNDHYVTEELRSTTGSRHDFYFYKRRRDVEG
jgi:regulator of sigma D